MLTACVQISFTGSTAVGKIILKSAADNVKNVTMELGEMSGHGMQPWCVLSTG